MNSQECDEIIDDLLRKHPLKVYSDEVLFRLGLIKETDVEKYILQRFFKGQSAKDLGRRKATLTRRKRRLWGRLKKAIKVIIANGKEGIYRITSRWGTLTVGYVYACSNDEAIQLAKLFLLYSLREVNTTQVRAEFVRFGSAIHLSTYNDPLLKELKKKENMIKKNFQEAQKNLSATQNQYTALLTLQLQQLHTGSNNID